LLMAACARATRPRQYWTDSGILGKNFRQSVRELAAHCSNSNIVFGAHGSPPTLTGPAIWPIAIAAMGSRGGQRVLLNVCSRSFEAERTFTHVNNARPGEFLVA